MGDRARRLLPAVLAALALFLGVCAVVAPAHGLTGDRRAGNSPAMTAVAPAAIAHAVRRGADTDAQYGQRWQRHTGASSPMAAALRTALPGGSPAGWWWARKGPGARPAAGDRPAHHSRAPPQTLPPAA